MVLRVERSVSHMKMSPHRAVLNFTMFETYNLRVFVGKNNTMLKIQKLVSKMITYLECGRKFVGTISAESGYLDLKYSVISYVVFLF